MLLFLPGQLGQVAAEDKQLAGPDAPRAAVVFQPAAKWARAGHVGARSAHDRRWLVRSPVLLGSRTLITGLLN